MAEEQLGLKFVKLPDELEITTETKIVQYTYIKLDGKKFNVRSLLDDLEDVNERHCYITDYELAEVLVKLDILKSAGSEDWPASKGKNFDEFLNRLAKAYYGKSS